MYIPKKPKKFKTKSSYKVKLHSNYPRTPYEYTVYQLRILTSQKQHNNKELFPLRQTLVYLINKGKITYHDSDCYISTNKQFLIDYFIKHQDNLQSVKHPEFNRLSKIYYSIKRLVVN